MDYSFKNYTGTAIINAFQKSLNESYRKPNKTWGDKGNKFYNRSMNSWPHYSDIEICWTHNEEKSVIAEIFIRTLKNKIYEFMTSVLKMCVLIN